MAYTLRNYFKFDLALLRKKGYKVGVPRALYQFTGDNGDLATLLLDFHSEGPARARIEIAGDIYGGAVRATLGMVQVPSNLGTSGGQWYFVCDVTGQLCRTLYFNGQSLVSRQALGGVLYKAQTHSHKDRRFWQVMDPGIKLQVLTRDWINKRNAKKYYQGKPTRMQKRWRKVRDQAAEVNSSLSKITSYL